MKHNMGYSKYRQTLGTGTGIAFAGMVWAVFGALDILAGANPLPAYAGISIVVVGFAIRWYAHHKLCDIYRDDAYSGD